MLLLQSQLVALNDTNKTAPVVLNARGIDCAKECPCGVPVIPVPDQWLEVMVTGGFKVWHIIFIIIALIVIMTVVYCCFHRCRIPRTKQEIEADLMRSKLTNKFSDYLQELPNEQTTFVEALKKVQEMEEKQEQDDTREAGARKRMGWLKGLKGKEDKEAAANELAKDKEKEREKDKDKEDKDNSVATNGNLAPTTATEPPGVSAGAGGVTGTGTGNGTGTGDGTGTGGGTGAGSGVGADEGQLKRSAENAERSFAPFLSIPGALAISMPEAKEADQVTQANGALANGFSEGARDEAAGKGAQAARQKRRHKPGLARSKRARERLEPGDPERPPEALATPSGSPQEQQAPPPAEPKEAAPVEEQLAVKPKARSRERNHAKAHKHKAADEEQQPKRRHREHKEPKERAKKSERRHGEGELAIKLI